MVHLKRIGNLALSVLLCYSAIFVHAQDLPEPWESRDIGNPLAQGSATFADDKFTVQGSGSDIWFTEDAFHYVYQPAKGDCEITAYISSIEQTADDAKACIMIRESLDANSAFVMAIATPGLGTYFQRRPSTGSECDHTNLDHGIPAPVWVKLVREGNTFTASFSEDGVTWSTGDPSDPAEAEIELAEEAYIGLGVTSHLDGVLCETVFESVTVDPGEVTSVNDFTADGYLKKYRLGQNYPNPFNPRTTIEYQLPQKVTVSLKIFDTNGQEVSTLVKEVQAQGRHEVAFDGSALTSGVYFYQLRAGDIIQTKKLILLK